MFFHSKDDFLNFAGRMAHKVYFGEKIQIQVRVQNTIQIERSLKNPREGDGDGYYKVCADHKFDPCLYNKLATIMKNQTKDNCTVPWVHQNDKICTNPKDIKAALSISDTRFTNQLQDCHRPCRSSTVDAVGQTYRKYPTWKHGELYVYFAYDVSKSKEHYFYTFYRLLAEVGGYVGLFLGYSLYHFVGSVMHLIEKKPKK